MFKRDLCKPDGRALHLYGRDPIDPEIVATSPSSAPPLLNGHLRWHPLRGEWVAYASHRQQRTFLPPKEFNPLAPTVEASQPTELPAGRYGVAVFDNLFPTLDPRFTEAPEIPGVATRPADGACEVVVFTQEAETSLGRLPLDHLVLVLEVLADRCRELGGRDGIRYVMPFENRGVEVGVTIHHPHGQIYAYPFVPPAAARELAMQEQFLAEHGRPLFSALLEEELRDGRRILYEGPEALAFVPPFARYTYEVWIAPRQPTPSLADLDDAGLRDLARALKVVLLKFDGLWQRPFPYLMIFHQAPTDGRPHPEAQLHIEIYPPYRTPGRLKYLAGTELGAGLFANDSIPEEKAAELQAVEVDLA